MRDPLEELGGTKVSAASTKKATAAAMGLDRPEETEFAEILRSVMLGELSAPDAIKTYADVCKARGESLRDLAQGQLQRAPRYHALLEAAAEMEAESATWELLWFLYGLSDRDFPAGRGGNFIEGGGFAKTFRQLAADVIFEDDVLNRAGRVVAWLEQLAAQSDPEPEQGLARKDGLWQETKAIIAAGPIAQSLMSASGAGNRKSLLVTELDPDAPTRSLKRLDNDNVGDEARLAKIIWRLLRTGQAARAIAACEHAGQPWRAALLSAAGEYGSLPLGNAAIESDAVEDDEIQAEMLGREIDDGVVASRSLWRWTCYQASERIASTSEKTGSSIHECAIFALLGTYLPKLLPACNSWQDALWAHLRCWLESSVDAAIATRQTSQQEEEGGIKGMETDVPSITTMEGAPDNVSILVDDAAVSYSKGWPIERIKNTVPRDFADAVERGTSGFEGVAFPPSDARCFRKIQKDLVLNSIEPLVDTVLVPWIMNFASVESPRSSVVDRVARDRIDGPPPAIMRFAAHLALALWSLGVACIPDDPTPSAAYVPLHDRLQRLVQVYAAHLIDNEEYATVPLYACHLRAGLRRPTFLTLMEHMIFASTQVETCRSLHFAMKDWLVRCQGGDIEENEMYLLCDRYVAKSQTSSLGGPMARARSLLWLCFEPDELGRVDTVLWTRTFCREFALSGSGGIAAALNLLAEVIPAGLGSESPKEGFERFLQESQNAGVEVAVKEVLAWTEYFEIESEFISWEKVYIEAVEETRKNGFDPSAGSLLELARETAVLLRAAEAFLAKSLDGWMGMPLDVVLSSTEHELVPAGGGPRVPSSTEATVVFGPALEAVGGSEDRVDDVINGYSYQEFDKSDMSRACNDVFKTLKELASELQALNSIDEIGSTDDVGQFMQVGPAPEEGSVNLPGLMSVAIDFSSNAPSSSRKCKGSTFRHEDISLMIANLMKGACAPVGPLVATNLEAPPEICLGVCRAIIVPRMALKVAALRLAVVYMGLDVPPLEQSDGDGAVFRLDDAKGKRWKLISTMIRETNAASLLSANEMEELQQHEQATKDLLNSKKLPQGQML